MNARLELADVSVSLRDVRALQDASLRVERGNIVALLGPNGAGKTTLIRAALGLIKPAAGKVTLDGEDPAALTPRQRALRASYLPQRPQAVWPVSVESLVALGRFAHGAAPERLGERDRAAVDAAIDACGLGALRRRRMDEVSGGERVRAHMARALAQGAPLLMLDEPTAGLDPAQALGVADVLRGHAKDGGATLMATHDLALAARIAEWVVVLREGRMLAQGAPREALTPETIESAYGRNGRVVEIDGALAAVFG